LPDLENAQKGDNPGSGARQETARHNLHIRRPCAPPADAGAGVACEVEPDPPWLAAGDAADRRVACRPPFRNRWTDCSAVCRHTLGRLVRLRRDSSTGNAKGNAWRLSFQV